MVQWFLKKTEMRDPVSDLVWDARRFVVHVINDLNVGGAERFLVQLLAAQAELGWRTAVVTLGEPNPLARDLYGKGILYRGCGRARLNDPRLVLDILGVLQRLRPDVVHTHLFYADTFGRVAARLARVSAVVSTEHSTEGWALSRRRRAAMRCTARLAQRLVSVSAAVQRTAAVRLRLPPDRFVVIPNGIDLEAPARAEPLARADLGLGRDEVVVGCVGRLVESKNYDVLLRALAAVADTATSMHVLMAGDGPARAALERLAATLGITKRVRWLGRRRDVPRLLASIDIFVLPSTFEGHSVALLEAMAAGRACVVSDIPELAETVGDAAVRVAPGDAEALAAALAALAADPDRRERLGEAARQAVQRFSIVAAARRYLDLYEEILAARE
jgi:glycosyltransferase involved in cell wall biosynthesis